MSGSELSEVMVQPFSDSPESGTSLEVFSRGKCVFKSDGKWLYPLFELEETIGSKSLQRESLFLHDKIAGRAAAALICRMGISRCHIDTISKPASDLFRMYEVNCTFTSLVEKIQCRTEDIINSGMELEEIYRLLRSRAKLT